MENIIHSDIFFFITSICVMLITLLFVFLLYKIIKILITVEILATNLKKIIINIKNGNIDFKDIIEFFTKDKHIIKK